jgi:hypothetical protein
MLEKKIAKKSGEPSALPPQPPPVALTQREINRLKKQRDFKFEQEALKIFPNQKDLRNRYVAVRSVLADDFPENKVLEFVNLPFIRQRSETQKRLYFYEKDIISIINSNRLIQNKKTKEELIALVMRTSNNQAREFVNGNTNVDRH